jgi:hypothetical protein
VAGPIHVVATTMAGTREAVVTASALAQALDSRVHVIAAKPMPADWSLDQQAALVHSFARTIRKLTQTMDGRIDVLPCVCRRLMDVMQLLPSAATVIIAGRSHRWWATPEQRLALDLQSRGYHVVFIHMSEGSPAAPAEG